MSIFQKLVQIKTRYNESWGYLKQYDIILFKETWLKNATRKEIAQ